MTYDRRQTTDVVRKGDDIAEMLLDYSVKSLKLSFSLPRNDSCRHIADQLVRSSTAGGANYEEARGSESRADFIYKVSLVKKEIRESLYWLKLIERSALADTDTTSKLCIEADKLIAIMASSVKTARKNARRQKDE